MQANGNRYTVVGRWLCLLVLVIAALDLAAWATRNPQLTRIISSWPTVAPLTAVALALLAVAVLAASASPGAARPRAWLIASRAAAAMVIALAVTMLIEYAADWQSPLDLLLWGDQLASVQASFPGRLSPQTATSTALLGVAALLLPSHAKVPDMARGWLLVAGAAPPAVAVTGFLYSAVDLFVHQGDNGMALSSATSLLLLVAAAALIRPDGRPLAWIRGPGERRILLWLMLLFIALPLAFRSGDLLAEAAGATDSADAVAILFTMLVLAGGVLLIGITQRRMETRAEEQIGAERDRHEVLIAALSDGFCSLRLDGTVLSVNPAARALLGEVEPGDQLLDRFRFSITDAASGPVAADPSSALRQLRSGLEVRDDSAVALNTPIGDLPVSLLLFPIVVHDAVTGFGATFRDVSERVESDRRIRRLARAVDASADAVYVTTPSGEIEYVNTAFTTITGWPAAEVMGRNPRIWQSGLNDPKTYEAMWTKLGAGEVWSGRLLNKRRRSSGEEEATLFWAQSTVAPYFDEDGTLLGYVALQRDVTDLVARDRRQRSEGLAALLRAEAGYALNNSDPLADRIGAALAILANGMVRHADGPWTAALVVDGVADPIDTVSERLVFIRGSAEPAALPELEAALGRPLAGLTQLTRFGPDVTPSDSTEMGLVIPLGQDSGITGHLMLHSRTKFERDDVIRDAVDAIADLLALAIAGDRARLATQSATAAAESAVRAKSQFLATMSHEIRTPMNGVLGMLDMLAFTDLEARQREYVTVAQSSAESLLTIIDDILDFSKIEAGKLSLESIPFDVRAVTEDVTALYLPQATGKGLALHCRLSPKLPGLVQGDPTRLRQVLSNLVGNAVKFTESGQIDVRLSASAGGGGSARLVFEVEDTGIGMPTSTLTQLFTSFAQGDASTTRRFGGTGLGLAICHELVTMMGGTIKATSADQVGTTFTVEMSLPVLSDSSSSTSSLNVTDVRVLVVDDDETNRNVLVNYLRQWKIGHDVASDAAQALELLAAAADQNRPFEIALLDHQLPGLDGPELASRVRADPELDATKLVLVSSGGLDTGSDLGGPIRVHGPQAAPAERAV